MKLPSWMNRRIAVIIFILGVVLIALGFWAYGTETIGSLCTDGWISDSFGRGRCSNHGGVEQDIVVDTIVGQQPAPWIGATKWLAMTFGVVAVLTGLFGIGASVGSSEGTAKNPATGRANSTSSTKNPDVLPGEYLELTVQVQANPQGYMVQVTTPTGQQRRTLRNQALPTDRGEDQLAKLVAAPTRRRFGSRQAKAVEAFGTSLFDALFDGATEQAFRDSIDLARSHNANLRIVLQVDDGFADIPWEYLFDPRRGSFLARSGETTLVRLLPTDAATRTQPDISCLRVLSMASSPKHSQALDVAVEQERIRAALAVSVETGRVELNFVSDGTFDRLREALASFQPHIFHFAGHGDWSPDRDDGVILFEDSSGHADPVTGLDLGALLNRPDLRLAIFNSCHAATPSKHDRFAGVTSSLVAQGVPAAIGMQFPFEDKAAVTFATSLLQELGRGTQLDIAVTQARFAVFALPNKVEWGTPVLTTRTTVEQVIPRTHDGATYARG